MLGYYEDAGLVCQSCSDGCSDCFFNGSSEECTSCNTTNGFILMGGACSCSNGTVLQNGACVPGNGSNGTNSSNSSMCGNSIVEGGEACDDGNSFSGDGCSSSCQVEPSHACFVNSSLANYSICYYNGQIEFTTE